MHCFKVSQTKRRSNEMPATVKGGVELRKALRKFTPDLAKETQKEIKLAIQPISKSAKGYVPDRGKVLSGWLPRQMSEATFPSFNPSLVKSGIGYKTSPSKANSRGFRSLAQVFNKTRAGAIYERMGKVNPQSQFVLNQDGKFRAPLKGKGRMQGRVLYRSYDENKGKAREGVLKAIQTSANKLNARASVKG
jgi:hypothetical protein